MQAKAPISRRTFLKTGILTGAIAGTGLLGVALYEPHEVVLEQHEIWLGRLPRALDGFRLAQISDIHFGDFTYEHHLRRAVDAVNAQNPDLVVITGDFVSAPVVHTHSPVSRRHAAEKILPSIPVLKQLRSRHGSLAVLGNHDMLTDRQLIIDSLATSGVRVLRNASVPIEAGGARYWLAGMDDVLEGRPDLTKTLHDVPAGECVVLAVHEPDVANIVQQYPVDFQISGHSHGGQVRFPIVGPLYLPPLAKKYVMGFYRVGPLQLYTNRGLGVIHLPVRFMCPPEVTVFTLRSA